MGKEKNSDYKIEWNRVLKRISPYNIKKGFKYLSHYGFKGFWVKLNERFTPEEIPYDGWYQYHFADTEELVNQRKYVFKDNPVISIIVPVYETPEKYLRAMIDSVVNQTYTNWELCIADGSSTDLPEKIIIGYETSRIKYKRLEENNGIADNTNEAIKLANGEYIALLDHDDVLEPDALFEVIKVINNDNNIDLIYTDEDKTDESGSDFFQPALKPDFNLDLLRSNNYICHFVVVRKKLVDDIKGFRNDFDGAQDYDFLFRIIENTNNIQHISKILYHWRVHQASTAENPASKMYAFEAGKNAIEAHLNRCEIKADVSHTKNLGFYRVRYLLDTFSRVSIIIPNKDNKEMIERCIKSIRKTSYKNYEIIVVENNSTEDKTFEYYDSLNSSKDIKVLKWTKEFNYSAINNFGVKNSDGEYLLFLNNDVEFINEDWMEEMLSNCIRKEVGITGVKLYYPDDTIQHAGTIIGIGGIAGHAFVGMPRSQSGYFHKASIQLDLSAVTAACMMIKREVFENVGGFDENLKVAFNDVDLCLKVRKKGYLVVYNPYVEAYHYESKSRGKEDTKEKVMRFQSEIEYMRTKWIEILKNGDPYYNKNLALDKWNYSLRNNH